ncbi:TetR/AcrR family transcriptional regulator [Clostridium tunisiense]|uniref:TetR/AcrR family transcriptional regulator n=1 Tax=Clostridium tunisiense TaxID=219748 RepID=UPI0002D6F897|nr:TetR/AcrR family transcriptional regulator [Clostridium tunisiense]
MPKFTEAEKEKIKLEIMDIAHQCFIAKGLKNTSIEEITSAVSIAKSSFYVFFESKEMLYLKLLEHEGQEIEKKVWPKVKKAKDVPSAIKIYLHAMALELESKVLTQRLITNLEEYNLVARKVDQKYTATNTLRSIVPLMEFIKKNKELKNLINEEVEVIAGVIRATLAMVIHKRDASEETYPKIQEILFNAVANELTNKALRSE